MSVIAEIVNIIIVAKKSSFTTDVNINGINIKRIIVRILGIFSFFINLFPFKTNLHQTLNFHFQNLL